ncbi:amidohydrolase family protein [bacterium]|nr:amidohydrolase family protein [bacterium]
MWQETTAKPANRAIWENEFEDFLPERILDFHVHVFNAGVVPPDETYSCAGHALTRYDIEDLAADLDDAYPGRKTSAVCFGLPHANYDRDRNNRYIAENCDNSRFYAFRLFDPNEDPQAVRCDIERNPYLGLKPYLNYVRVKDPESVTIRDMLPDWIMEIADSLGLIIMLHIPKKGRLADPTNQKQIVEICRQYPSARIVLAHIGRAYYLKNIVGHLDNLKDLPNLYYDLAMVNHWEVIAYLFDTVDPQRVLLATDTPIALAPGKSVEINDQYTYVTPVPWHLSITDDHGKLRFTSFLYEELRAVKRAWEKTRKDDAFLQRLFYGNGTDLLNRATAAKTRAPASR